MHPASNSWENFFTSCLSCFTWQIKIMIKLKITRTNIGQHLIWFMALCKFSRKITVDTICKHIIQLHFKKCCKFYYNHHTITTMTRQNTSLSLIADILMRMCPNIHIELVIPNFEIKIHMYWSCHMQSTFD